MQKKFLGKIPKTVRFFSIAVVLVVAGFFVFTNFFGKNDVKTESTMTNSAVTRGDIENIISGSGSVEPLTSYNIVSLVAGDIIESPFYEGDKVKKGDLLYRVDDEDMLLSMTKAENSLKKSQLSAQEALENISQLTVKASASGYVCGLNAEVGDQINGDFAEIRDYSVLTLEAEFYKWQIQKMTVGSTASAVSGTSGATYSGTVTAINNVPTQSSLGEYVYTVELKFVTSNAMASGTTLFPTVTASGETFIPVTPEITTYKNPVYKVTAKTSGKLAKLYVKNGSYVQKGQTVAVLQNDSLMNTAEQNALNIQDQQASLDQQKAGLTNYNITSPIDGTVLSKSYKEGDTVSSSDKTALMQVADITKLKFTISVDELDIAKIQVGQAVSIRAEALSGKAFTGEVTSVKIVGTSSSGVTTYPVEIVIGEPGGLLVGMNVTAEIIVASRQDVLLVPVNAVVEFSGATYVRTAVADAAAQGAAGTTAASASGSRDSGNGLPSRQPGGQGTRGGTPSGSGSAPAESGAADTSRRNGASGGMQNLSPGDSTVMGGYVMVCVETGISDDDYIEIISGLSEGDAILVPATSGTSGVRVVNMNGGAMGGGMAMAGGGPRG